ncbi:hypothetical protein KM043_009638 [Ampulex compressa]|nr:hypothetical protein KM043_009638 [Ampulex compressa]
MALRIGGNRSRALKLKNRSVKSNYLWASSGFRERELSSRMRYVATFFDAGHLKEDIWISTEEVASWKCIR